MQQIPNDMCFFRGIYILVRIHLSLRGNKWNNIFITQAITVICRVSYRMQLYQIKEIEKIVVIIRSSNCGGNPLRELENKKGN